MPPNIFFLYDIKNKVVLYYMSLPSCCVFFAITFPLFTHSSLLKIVLPSCLWKDMVLLSSPAYIP